MRDLDRARAAMVRSQLVGRDITDPRVLAAFEAVPRHRFVLPGDERAAYTDSPLPIGEGQTISQPYMVAFMVQSLKLQPSDRVLEVGTGSGYAATICAHLAAAVLTVERLPGLAAAARRLLAELDVANVTVVEGDGSVGWPQQAPYDAILVSAGAPNIPKALVDQLAPGGRLVVPVGDRWSQQLLRVRRTPQGDVTDHLGGVRFVPLLGAQGWPA
ncbi:MAG TPA: protein-L-isoaspartate(D-aspartate) O-methyltransferase [Acidimicrobiales bacterium]